jgi:RimJ/RimL family protein N-acetyltransferase
MSAKEVRSYPRSIRTEDGAVEVRPLQAADSVKLMAFVRGLPQHDLLFLPRDISQAKVLNAWVQANERGQLSTLVANKGKEIVGTSTIAVDPLSWSPHVGEMRIVIAPAMRRKGLGRGLTQECFALALTLGLEKLTGHMTVDQKGAIAVFEGLGFRPEALLRNHVKDSAGTAHDIVILAHDVARFAAQQRAYGITDAF